METGDTSSDGLKTSLKEGAATETNGSTGGEVTGKEESLEDVKASAAQTSSAASLGGGSSKLKTFKPPENWVNAPEFVPSWLAPKKSGNQKNVSSCESESAGSNDSNESVSDDQTVAGAEGNTQPEDASSSATPAALAYIDSTSELCPYAMNGECRYGFKCLLIHGLKCDYCSQFCLHPNDPSQRERHRKSCIAEHESNMNLSFAIASSIEKICGICYEKVLSKNSPGEQRFGILPNCNHCYCLSCIRRWRSERQFDNKTIRACPECRVTSDFVCPSRYWVDNKEDKEKLISSYKVALSKKPCRYYRNGDGQCPFGNKCFYLHAIDGRVIDVGPPRRISGARASVRAQTLSIWEYIEEWELQWLDLEDFMGMFDSDTTSEFSFPDMDDDLDEEGLDELYVDWDNM